MKRRSVWVAEFRHLDNARKKWLPNSNTFYGVEDLAERVRREQEGQYSWLEFRVVRYDASKP